MRRTFVLTLTAVVLICAMPHAQPARAGAIAIVGARLVDGTGNQPVDDSVIVIAGDRIQAAGPRARVQVPAGATVIDAKGKVLIPGLVDVHCHINQPAEDMKRYWLAQLRWGVTTMRSAGNDKPETVPLFRQTRDGTLLAPRAYTAGQGFSVSGPYPGAPTFKPTTPEEARDNVRNLKAQNVDLIKIWMTNPKFPPEVITAIVDEGRKQEIPIVAHVTDVASLHQLADQGVTDFLHTPTDQPVTPELVAYAKAKKLSFAPTLANGEARWFYYEHPDILNMPMLQAALYPRGRQMLADPERKRETLSAPDLAQRKARLREVYPFIKAMADAGVRIAVGTDCGAEASQVTPFGHATHRELQMYVEAGMPPLAAIRAATLDAARVITHSEDPDYGSIQAGKAADLVLLDADPIADINNTIKINRVMRAGRWLPAADAEATLEIEDYVATPVTGVFDGKGSNEVLLSRVNTIREEVGGARRLFMSDLNGPLYIFDKAAKQFTEYLNFNGNPGKNGVFRRLFVQQGYGNGVNGFYLDPEYTKNGKFYTTHMEDPASTASILPDNSRFPGFNVTGYTTTAPIKTPGPVQNEGVLIAWTDTNPSNATFEGTARELFRVQLNTRSHPLGDLIFNPAARPGDPDWRVLYIECGDGASGESKIVEIRSNPQRLDNFEGKILRIIPDLDAHVSTSSVSENGRYRIPNDNPFVSTPGARKEIWAYGFRNPHRLSWAIDPSNPANNHLIAASVGLQTWETAYIVRKGANYGYSLREGTELLQQDNKTAPLPAVDKIPMQIGEQPTSHMLTPSYPVIQYGHDANGGDAIGSGFVYNGRLIPSLRGKYVFTDLTTGHVWYADYKEMLAADDGKPETVAAIYPLKVAWNDPNDSPDAGKKVYDSFYPIVEAAYHARGGKRPTLPGPPGLVMGGRADVRFAIDADGELYLYSKGDAMIRRVVAAQLPHDTTAATLSSPFVAHSIDTNLRGGYQTLVVDLNRDGKLDVIGLASGLKELAWYENPTWEKHVLVNGVSGLINVAAYDVDQDGIPELAVAHEFSNVYQRSAGLLSILAHQGDPRQPWSIKEIDRIPTTHRVRFVDIDGKGTKVLVNAPLIGANAVAPDYRDHVGIYYYRPGEWKRLVVSEADEGVVHGLWVTPWKDKAREALLSAGFLGVFAHEYENGHWTRAPIAKGDPAPWPKSGASDIAVGRIGQERFLATIEPWHGHQVAVYREEKGAWTRTVIDDALTDGHTLVVGDFDGDGRDDLVAGERGGKRSVYLYRLTDPKTNVWSKSVLDDGMAGAGCSVADLNGDRRPDIVCIGTATANLKWYENTGAR
jgi:imidazolonepropionase-like amidohydrolase